MRIVPYACTDGGYTGRSLSLVSQVMREVVRPVRYHSVSITKDKYLDAFARLIREADSSLNVHHLFIAIDVETHSPNTLTQERRRSLIASIASLITYTSPTLHSLVCLPQFDLIPWGTHFPVLTDLTTKFSNLTHDQNLGRRYPSLLRLHLIAQGMLVSSIWQEIVYLGPALTHLRFSGIFRYTYLPPFLRAFLGLPAKKGDWRFSTGPEAELMPGGSDVLDAAAKASALPDLHSILVQTQRGDWALRNYGTILDYDIMVEGLRSVADACAQGEGSKKLYLVPEVELYTIEDALEDWRDYVSGGEGPWRRTLPPLPL